ncbi:MAG TPA: zinc-ribbon domain containing protein [Planctomycetota bacterium]|nr:zinc-ribbon domain containing protein [Planctomycetota bacterium]
MKRHRCPERYAEHVEHPRYGKAPHVTGVDPNPDDPAVHLHWNTRYLTEAQLRRIERTTGWHPVFPNDGTRMVPGTAVAADVSRQTPATVAITHYYDIDKVCRDCRRRFIFFAQEQKHWYEDLGFPLEADAVRCPPCRKRMQDIGRARKRYEQLSHVASRSFEETLEMAGSCLMLIEAAVFHQRQTEHVRTLLKRVPEEAKGDRRVAEITARLMTVEAEARKRGPK